MLSTYKHDFKRRRTHNISESETEDDEPFQISTSAATIQKSGSPKTEMSGITCLPSELLLLIFMYLEKETLHSVSLVCKKWLQISKTPKLWEIFSISTFTNSDDCSRQHFLLFIYRHYVKKLEVGFVDFHKTLRKCDACSVTFERLTVLHLVPILCFYLNLYDLFKLINERCPSLESLSFECIKVSILIQCLSILQDLKLKELNISCTEEGITVSVVKKLKETFPNLCKLHIKVASDDEVKVLLNECTCLRSIGQIDFVKR